MDRPRGERVRGWYWSAGNSGNGEPRSGERLGMERPRGERLGMERLHGEKLGIERPRRERLGMEIGEAEIS